MQEEKTGKRFRLKQKRESEEKMPRLRRTTGGLLPQTQGGKIPHTERSKQISADARNFKTRLLAQIPMTVSDGLKKGNRNEQHAINPIAEITPN